MSTDPGEDRLIVLRHPDLRRYLSARFIASIATQVQTVAVGWQVFRVTGDPFDLGLVALSQFLPFVVLILPAGHVADRYDRRRIQLVTYVLLAACAAALLALALAGSTDTGPVFAVMVLFGGAEALLPIYAGEILDVGPVGLGIMRAAPAVGAGVLAAIVAIRPIRRHVGRWMFGGVFVFGVATMLFGISTSFPLSLAALIVMGAGDMVSVYIRHLLVQLETPDAIRGGVSAVNSVFIGASNELGEFESGITASWWGIVPAVVVGGAATLVVAGAWTRVFGVLRRLDTFPEPELGPEADAQSR